MAAKTITDIAPQKKRKGRVNVYLDDTFWCGMSQELASELELKRGRRLSNQEQKYCQDKVVAREALDYCLRRLTMRRSSTGQLKEKLRERGHDEEVIEAAIERLEELLLINDDQYARDLINQRLNKGQWGIRISQALDKAGIDKKEGRRLLEEILADKDEAAVAEKALVKKYPNPLDINDRRRAQAFLVRRGFSGALAREITERRAMDPDKEAAIFNEEAARELLRRKKRIPGKDAASRQKAFAYLMRRGFSSDVIRKAIG